MRVIAGRLRGRPLTAPAGSATRPTADRVRETLFSMLASRLGSFDGLAVADLYAGSGALGIEALSRGAAHCHFVDSGGAAIAALRTNVERLGILDQAMIVNSRVETFAPSQSFQLIFADPPYGFEPARALANRAVAWLDPGGWLAIETERGSAPEPGDLGIAAERDVGRARLTLLRRP